MVGAVVLLLIDKDHGTSHGAEETWDFGRTTGSCNKQASDCRRYGTQCCCIAGWLGRENIPYGVVKAATKDAGKAVGFGNHHLGWTDGWQGRGKLPAEVIERVARRRSRMVRAPIALYAVRQIFGCCFQKVGCPQIGGDSQHCIACLRIGKGCQQSYAVTKGLMEGIHF